MGRRMISHFALPAVFLMLASCALTESNRQIPQKMVEKIEVMPRMPEPYEAIDWKKKAANFDNLVFDFSAEGAYRPLIWLDDAGRNFDQQTFGIYTALGDVRQGKEVNNGEFHESLASLGALMSAGLVGIDKTNQDGHNYVKMAQNYFNRENGWNIMMNNTSPEVAMLGGGYGRDWWYDVYPNLLYYAVSDLFPGIDRADSLLRIIADQFFLADSVLDGNYDYSYFDYAAMEGKRNNIPFQQDAAAGHAYVLCMAYCKFGDQRYLEGAESALEALLDQPESRFYEVLMPFGAYVAARLNAREGTAYNYDSILDWTFNGCLAEDGRTGWGVIAERWGDYDVYGMQGSMPVADGYGFLMNTFSLAWPLVPLVRYDPRYARAVGKWLLHASSAARLCYPYHIPDENQWLPGKKSVTKNAIAYEGIRKKDMYGEERLAGVSPVALGDGPRWTEGQPEVSMFSIYGSAYAGIFGAIVNKTNVPGILQLDCLATDFYHEDAYPTYLYFNPYSEPQKINYMTRNGKVNLYDMISGKVITEEIQGEGTFTIDGEQVRVIVEIPSDMEVCHEDGVTRAGDVIVSFF